MMPQAQYDSGVFQVTPGELQYSKQNFWELQQQNIFQVDHLLLPNHSI